MTFRVRVDGLSDLKVQLDRLRKATGKAALQRAALDAMEPMARLARQLAPKDEGELSESIDVGFAARDEEVGRRAFAGIKKAGGSDADALAAMRDARRSAKGVRGDLYVDVFMGPVAGRTRDEIIKGFVQEFGNSRQAPQSYMRPAFEQDKAAMLERLRNDLWFEVSSAVARSQARGTLRG